MEATPPERKQAVNSRQLSLAGERGTKQERSEEAGEVSTSLIVGAVCAVILHSEPETRARVRDLSVAALVMAPVTESLAWLPTKRLGFHESGFMTPKYKHSSFLPLVISSCKFLSCSCSYHEELLTVRTALPSTQLCFTPLPFHFQN